MLKLPDGALRRGPKVREGDCRNGLMRAAGDPQHLTFLWKGSQDTSFIKGIGNTLVRRATLKETLCGRPLYTDIGNRRRCHEIRLCSYKGDDGSRLPGLWFLPEWSTSRRGANSGPLFTQALPVELPWAPASPLKVKAPPSKPALSTQGFPLSASGSVPTPPPPFSPRRPLLLWASQYLTSLCK